VQLKANALSNKYNVAGGFYQETVQFFCRYKCVIMLNSL
jgi:hypothetical protein